MSFLTNLAAIFMSVITFLSSFLGIGDLFFQRVNYDDFVLVWEDNFDGTDLDRTKWNTSGDNTGVRRGGYWNGDLARVEDGNLVIYSKYLENGVNPGDPAGWYTTSVNTSGLFEQTYGYYEVRCILPKGLGQWSAFWFMNDDGCAHPYPDGSYGGEIDVFEAPYYGYTNPDRVIGAVHWGGYAEGHRSIAVKYNNNLLDSPYEKYNTYGFEWNEDEYVIYFNGRRAGRVTKSDAIPSQVPMYMLLSTEIAGFDGVPEVYWAKGTAEDNGRDFVGKFVIDYVKAYQYK